MRGIKGHPDVSGKGQRWPADSNEPFPLQENPWGQKPPQRRSEGRFLKKDDQTRTDMIFIIIIFFLM